MVKVTSWRSTPDIEWIYILLRVGFPGSLVVKNPSAMQETRVPSLDRKDLLEEEMATHSSVLAWRIPWTEDPGRLQSMELQRVRHDLVTNQFPYDQQQD